MEAEEREENDWHARANPDDQTAMQSGERDDERVDGCDVIRAIMPDNVAIGKLWLAHGTAAPRAAAPAMRRVASAPQYRA
ncbi:hypothetical protein GCM10007387_15280 [Pseudoduganella albidiflava]|uniref:Uncharacterized protein n=1 Tax=Pseudoduganella albidiflava TaxID=321983 RepID=A0AA87XV81_9BURK|nr:hypothetical protein GCM10007387_15280 [Pseudoduganella albidiflava]